MGIVLLVEKGRPTEITAGLIKEVFNIPAAIIEHPVLYKPLVVYSGR